MSEIADLKAYQQRKLETYRQRHMKLRYEYLRMPVGHELKENYFERMERLARSVDNCHRVIAKYRDLKQLENMGGGPTESESPTD